MSCPPSVTHWPAQALPSPSYCSYFPPYVESSSCGERVTYKPDDGYYELCINNITYLARAKISTTDHPLRGRDKPTPTWEVIALSNLLLRLGA